MKLINKLMIVPMALLPFSAMAVTAPAVVTPKPEVLSLKGATITLNNTFKYKPVFREGGTQIGAKMKPLSDPEFSWAAGYVWNHAIVGSKVVWPPAKKDFPSWTSNNAGDSSPNADMMAKMKPQLQPLHWGPGMLYMTANKMPADLAKTVGNADPKGYIGSTITSYPFAQTYGVFTINARLPKGKGLWPAFWLLPYDLSWPPEIDIFEVLGADTKTLYTTVHSMHPKGYYDRKGDFERTTQDLSEGWHEYTLDWGPDELKWYFDRKLIFRTPTPATLKKPCYMLVNLAVGKSTNWGGAPDAQTQFPATMMVDSITAYQRDTYVTP